MLHHATLAPRGPARGTVVLLHGFGADEEDMLGIGLSLPRDLLYVSLRGPLQLPWGGHAWYPLRTVPGGAPDPAPWPADGGREPRAPDLRTAVGLVAETLRALPEHLDLHPETTVLAGFSQGAAVASSVMLDSGAPRLAGYAALSGYPPEQEAGPAPGALHAAPVFVAHGTGDRLLPVALGRALCSRLEAAGATVTYREYPLGHEVGDAELADLARWLGDVLPRPRPAP